MTFEALVIYFLQGVLALLVVLLVASLRVLYITYRASLERSQVSIGLLKAIQVVEFLNPAGGYLISPGSTNCERTVYLDVWEGLEQTLRAQSGANFVMLNASVRNSIGSRFPHSDLWSNMGDALTGKSNVFRGDGGVDRFNISNQLAVL